MTPFQMTAHESIDPQAATWFARNRNQPDSNCSEQFNSWKAVPAHARAYAEFESLWADLGELKQLNKPVPLPRRRRSVLALATAAAVLCAVFALNIGTPVQLHQQQIATQSQDAKTVRLPDGSTLTVNANTRLRIDFSASQRDIYLDRGQLYIEVAANKEQPLVVHAGHAQVRVVGTGFDVRRSQRQLVVSVAHGQVAFIPDGKSAALLGASQRATYDYAKGSLEEQSLSPGEVADWRSGHLSFRNRELASLVDELDLYRPGVIELADGPLGRYKVSGNLDVSDPLALVKALPALIPVKNHLLDNGKIRIEPR
ncbi:FecR domain-containing protein [Pseudomonas sp. 9.1(2019)]|uniref:FecR family protein n=1 Tax=Pseudomonas sp. 9.1(2019) TaxID=2580568 RepID=UPI001371A389|nr:FecR domain-containing protein [Pseudomonas sp. 9.1(2019)]NBG93593.1 iron dicitrate transport regulator FecR [Pseudomonas sp. 9.1(2019)]